MKITEGLKNRFELAEERLIEREDKFLKIKGSIIYVRYVFTLNLCLRL